MTRTLLPSILVMMLLLGCGGTPAKRKSPSLVRLRFPVTRLHEGERIISFSVTFTCWHVEQVSRIPYDWQIDISGPSWQPVASGAYGHGTAALDRLSDLDDMFVLEEPNPIPATQKDCREVHATITTVDFSQVTRELHFSNSQLQLVKDGT